MGLLCLCLVVVACGGGSSSSSGSSGSPVGQTEAEPSAQFLQPNSPNNKIVKFGQEASAEERAAANAVVTESLKARAGADFATQCETLSKKAISEVPGAKGSRDCPAKLKKFAEPLSDSQRVRADSLTGPVAAFRVKGDDGYVLYHGNDGKDHALPLEKEEGTWKVAALLTIEL